VRGGLAPRFLENYTKRNRGYSRTFAFLEEVVEVVSSVEFHPADAQFATYTVSEIFQIKSGRFFVFAAS
jgi:hypothetical protein